MGWSSTRRHNALRNTIAGVVVMMAMASPLSAERKPPADAPAPAAPDARDPAALRISTTVDKTTLDLGQQMTLTITVEGEFSKAQLSPIEFPKAFQVVAQSRQTHVSIQLGQMQRSLSLIYVLAATEAGTFQLGPFEIVNGSHAMTTDPIQVIVNKPILPPGLKQTPRILL